jgi:hypothetical protein
VTYATASPPSSSAAHRVRRPAAPPPIAQFGDPGPDRSVDHVPGSVETSISEAFPGSSARLVSKQPYGKALFVSVANSTRRAEVGSPPDRSALDCGSRWLAVPRWKGRGVPLCQVQDASKRSKDTTTSPLGERVMCAITL